MGEAQSRQPVATPAAETLEAELDRIAALGLDEVRTLWREMTQQNASKALSGDLLARVTASTGSRNSGSASSAARCASCSTGWPRAEPSPYVI